MATDHDWHMFRRDEIMTPLTTGELVVLYLFVGFLYTGFLKTSEVVKDEVCNYSLVVKAMCVLATILLWPLKLGYAIFGGE